MVEKWSLQALENSLELEIMEPFRFNSFTVVLLVRRFAMFFENYL